MGVVNIDAPITEPTPNFIRINDILFPDVGRYTIRDINPLIHVSLITGNQTLTIVSPTSWELFRDSNGNPYANFDEVIIALAIILAPKSDVAQVFDGFFVEQNLVSGVSRDLNVDGSGLPVTFRAVMEHDTLLSGIHLYLQDLTPFDALDFGNLAVLTNGCLFRIDGHTFAPLKTNLDIAFLMSETTTENYLAPTNRHLIAFRQLRPRVIMRAGQNVEMIIRDKLDTIQVFRMAIRGNRI